MNGRWFYYYALSTGTLAGPLLGARTITTRKQPVRCEDSNSTDVLGQE